MYRMYLGSGFLHCSYSKIHRKPVQRFLSRKRHSENRISKCSSPIDSLGAKPESVAYVPTTRDYPLLKRQIFIEPWDTNVWNKDTQLGQISKTCTQVKRRGTGKSSELWRFSFHWSSKNGERFTATSVGKSKALSRQESARRFLALLHEKGVLSELSQETEEMNEKREALQKEEREIVTKESQLRADVYNFGASILAIPQVTITPQKSNSRLRSKRNSYIVTLSLKECNINIEESGTNLLKTELKAYSRFMMAVKSSNAKENTPSFLENGITSLSTQHGREFVFYYKRKSSKVNPKSNNSDQSYFEINREQKGYLISTQVLMDGEKIGAPVFASRLKEAEVLAYLTAAIDLAKKHPKIFKMFLSEHRSSSGEIIQPFVQVPLKLGRTELELMSQAATSVIRAKILEQGQEELSSKSSTPQPRRSFRSYSSSDELRHRNNLLKAQNEAFNLNPDLWQLREQKASLPMNKYKEKVLEIVNKNNFCVIVGETGSGKTTQVPTIILEDAIDRGKGTSVNIICTQPRRIAAKSVAFRVAYERGENLQETVGYHVYLDVKRPKNEGSICYCTTEILLKQLQNNPDDVMESISHIIVDEAHERDIPIDFLLITLKKIFHARLIAGKPVPRVVIMSATLNISLFANYFGNLSHDGTKIPCPSLTVPGKTYPVKRIYLDELLTILKENYGKKASLQDCSISQKYLEIERNFNKNSILEVDRSEIDEKLTEKAKNSEDALVPYNLVSLAIAHIVKSSSDGAILVFLPGLKDLEDVQKSLLRSPLGVQFDNHSQYKIILLHSLMKDAQNTLFEPSPGCRKIILATNIAETSITIPDVRYVVDTGKLNEMNYDPVTRIKNLKCTWISKSNSRQRSGRAGRVQNGIYYALFSENRFQSLRNCGLPQLLRSDLQDVCLSAKGQTLQYSIKEFLSDAIEKPSSQAVDIAIKDLVKLGALTSDEQITPLGELLHSLPVDPDLGKMVVLGVIFRCLDPLLMIAAAESEKDFFMRPISLKKSADQAKFSFGRNSKSDAITLINAFRHARYTQRTMPRHEYMDNMMQNFLNAGNIEIIQRKMFQIEQVLVNSGIIPRAEKAHNSNSFYCGHYMLNENADNQNLIKALILARCPSNLAVKIGSSNRFRTKTESNIQIRTGLNGIRFATRSSLPKAALISYASMYQDDSSALCFRDTNLISPLTAALFGGTLESRFRKLVTDDWIIYSINSELESLGHEPYHFVLRLRTALNAVLSNSFLDLARRKNLLDDRIRWAFTRTIAQILNLTDDLIKLEQTQNANNETMVPKLSREHQNGPSSPEKRQGLRNYQPFIRDLLSEIELRANKGLGRRERRTLNN